MNNAFFLEVLLAIFGWDMAHWRDNSFNSLFRNAQWGMKGKVYFGKTISDLKIEVCPSDLIVVAFFMKRCEFFPFFRFLFKKQTNLAFSSPKNRLKWEVFFILLFSLSCYVLPGKLNAMRLFSAKFQRSFLLLQIEKKMPSIFLPPVVCYFGKENFPISPVSISLLFFDIFSQDFNRKPL